MTQLSSAPFIQITFYRINGNICKWISNFHNRKQTRRIVNSYKSEWADVISGVHQICVLESILFIIDINDLPRGVKHCKTKIFADDIKVYARRYGNHPNIQNDIANITVWSPHW